MFRNFVAFTLPRYARDTRGASRHGRQIGQLSCPRVRRNAAPSSIGTMTVTASYQGAEIARSDRTVVVEGNHYFPADDVQQGVLQPSETHTVCSWKGEASYYDVVVGEHRNPDAAWYYPTPKEAAAEIADRVAFWKGVTVVEL